MWILTYYAVRLLGIAVVCFLLAVAITKGGVALADLYHRKRREFRRKGDPVRKEGADA